MPTTPVRTRFAPSPTGFLHVGGLRAALYNYLFAKHEGGTFLLRIEDTDQTRLVEGALENIIASMRWAGIDYDEGPLKEGDCGPYIQSKRTKLYHEHCNQLLESGVAYYCFCSSARLDELRAKQVEQKLPPMYDRRCRSLSADEVKGNLDAGMPHVVRQKIPLMGELTVHDLVRGAVQFQYRTLDDHVLMKSDGFPTYHLANIVDDHHMRISHVIRGEEWLPSTPRHVLLYEAFGWTPPQFAHLPLLLNPDRTKLSKRQGDVAAEAYRDKGYLPAALINFIALLGWNPGTEQEIYSLDEMVALFSMEHVHKAGAVFDLEKLRWMNGQYLKAMSVAGIADGCIPFLQAANFDTSDRVRIEHIVLAVRSHLHCYGDIVEHAAMFFDETVTPENDEAAALLITDNAKKLFAELAKNIEALVSPTPEQFTATLKQSGVAVGVKGKELFMPVRVALTGKTHGPELPLLVEALGYQVVLRRLRAL